MRNTSFSIASRFCLGLLLSLCVASEALAEIYKWKDAAGRLHFAQNLNQVPPKYRAQAAGGKVDPTASRAIQRYEPAPPAAVRKTRKSKARKRAGSGSGSGETYRIRVEKTGSSMLVRVRLNESVTAPFLIDTGASDVVIPASVAKELGLRLDGARTGQYSTANGIITQSLINLDSVNLGGARAENVPATVSTSMSIGLLGLSFFNHFEYRFDPGSGIVTLRSNGLVESGKIRGGRSADQWRRQFAFIGHRREAIEKTLDEINPNGSRRRGELKAEIEELERQKSILEGEADDARVPMQWRD